MKIYKSCLTLSQYSKAEVSDFSVKTEHSRLRESSFNMTRGGMEILKLKA